jgi:HK97 family phage prohead protease
MKNYGNTPDEVVEDKVLRRAFSGNVIKAINKESRTIEFIISTAAVDRYGDIIEVNGWDLKNYKANPVVLFGHMSHIPPIGKALKTWKDTDGLRSVAEFMPEDISPFAHSIFRMFEEGYLRAVSVGFKPQKWERINDDEDSWNGSYKFLKQELLEFSAVPIPANPEALVDARKKGIDTSPIKSWAEEMLDRWTETADPLQKLYGVDRQKMENVRRRAAGAGMSIHVSPDVQDALMKKNLESIRAAKAAKEAAKNAASLTIKGVEYNLPAVDTAKLKLGTVEMTKDEINNEVVLHVDKADDSAAFDVLLLDDDFISVEERGAEGEEKELVLTVKADNPVDYILLGFDAEKHLVYGVKSVADEEEEEEESSDDDSGDDDADEGTAAEDEESKQGEEGDAAEEGGEADTTEPTGTEAHTPTHETKGDEEEEIEIDLPTRLYIVEENMTELENELEKNVDQKKSLRDTRKMKFLAAYMRDLADLLDGGEGKKTATTLTVKAAPVDDGMSQEEAGDYIKGFANDLQPLLMEMIKSKISKLKGRLD